MRVTYIDDIENSEEFYEFIRGHFGNKGGFDEFLRQVKVKMEERENEALSAGDTDYHKGYVMALKWVMARPGEVLEIAKEIDEDKEIDENK